METKTTKWWVGVLKGHYTGHRVFDFEGDPEPSDCPDCNYIVGPFDTKEEAEKRALTETNQTGMFTDPFGPQPYGR